MGAQRTVAVRLELARRRRAGEPFDVAWAAVVGALPRERGAPSWPTALARTREAWRRAYEGEPAEPGELACAHLLALLADPEALGGDAYRVLVA
jgi:hypothetical protein